jgi:hypothetical protein
MSRTTTRRAFLTTAGAIAPAIAFTATTAAASECPKLLKLGQSFDAALSDLAKAKEAVAWRVDEWRHRWPLAPDNITWPSAIGHADAEKNIEGKPLVRSGARRARGLLSIEHLTEFGDPLQPLEYKAPPKSEAAAKRREKAEARRRVRHAARVQALRDGKAYYADIARIRKLSGIESLIEDRTAAYDRAASLVKAILITEAKTMTGLAIKGRAFTEAMRVGGGGDVISMMVSDPDKLFGDAGRIASSLS